jgi:hypothetical protein
MGKFGLPVVALLAGLCGALGWAVIASPAPTASTAFTKPSALDREPTAESAPHLGSDPAHRAAPPDGFSPGTPGSTPSPSPAPDASDVPVLTVPIVDAAVPDPASHAAAPSRVTVAALGVDVSVVPVGLDGRGNMELPSNPATAGWYEYGPAPASPAGATVVAAHVDSLAYGIGPFSALADAAPGTEIVVTDGAGVVRTYAVSTVDTTSKPDVVWASVFDRSGPPRLVLVTCGGEFDYTARHYLSNVIIVATPLG